MEDSNFPRPAGDTTLTPVDERQILSDFADWSGGFTPDECEDAELRTYASEASDSRFSEAAVLDFLRRTASQS